MSKITIFCDQKNQEHLQRLADLNPHVKRVHLYEALLSWALEFAAPVITTTRAGHKVPEGMVIRTAPRIAAEVQPEVKPEPTKPAPAAAKKPQPKKGKK